MNLIVHQVDNIATQRKWLIQVASEYSFLTVDYGGFTLFY